MLKNTFLLVLLITIQFLLTACQQNDYSDLEVFIHNSGEGLHGQIDSLPEVKPYKPFTYMAFDAPNPFAPRQNDQVFPSMSEIRPDLNRRKEVLESYPLESLAMVGSLQQHNLIYALIKSPEGILHRVKIGNYVGQNFGRINEVSESEIKLLEIIQEGANEWVERTSVLMLKN
ncbi:pilus assembly protein PilP [Nitrosomonas sp.]|uniref:pilus assembly protein PilP n=1 Tax=Nitrosomonas sp. TaxID=42353 RepID=UPI001D705A95|nr:pilus assembly protein PilP [Nitrosomonas sp.]MBX3616415.1 pilus assembly protein PilP [Nitrosomonas sp.]